MNSEKKNMEHDRALYAFAGEQNIDTIQDQKVRFMVYEAFSLGFDAGWDMRGEVRED